MLLYHFYLPENMSLSLNSSLTNVVRISETGIQHGVRSRLANHSEEKVVMGVRIVFVIPTRLLMLQGCVAAANSLSLTSLHSGLVTSCYHQHPSTTKIVSLSSEYVTFKQLSGCSYAIDLWLHDALNYRLLVVIVSSHTTLESFWLALVPQTCSSCAS